MSSIWLEVRRALREDAERAGGVAAEEPVERRDGVEARAHVHDRLHDHLHHELRALQRIGGREPEPPYYPEEGKEPAVSPAAKKEAGA